MKKNILILSFFLFTALSFSQKRPVRVDVVKQDQITTTERDTYVVPLNQVWYITLTDGTKQKNVGGSGWINETGLDSTDQAKLNNISITQAVDLDDIESKANSALQSYTETDPTVNKAKIDGLGVDYESLSNKPSQSVVSQGGRVILLRTGGTQAQYDAMTTPAGIDDILEFLPTDASSVEIPTDAYVTGGNLTGSNLILQQNGISDVSISLAGLGSVGAVDATVIDGSTNAVSGNGVFDAIQAIDLSVASKVSVEGGVATYANGIIIPDGVTSIGDNAFNGLKISSLTLPSSLVSIGNNAFTNNNISSLVIPNNTTIIGTFAFGQNRLTSLTLGSGVITIGNQAFQSNFLTSVTITNSVTSIGASAFSLNQLTTITIPNSVTFIGVGAFQSNQLTSFTWNNNLTEIPPSTFLNNPLTSVTIPLVVTSIGSSAFQSCTNLSSVTIHANVTSIGNSAFLGTAITSVSLPTGITLGTNAFPAGTTITYY